MTITLKHLESTSRLPLDQQEATGSFQALFWEGSMGTSVWAPVHRWFTPAIPPGALERKPPGWGPIYGAFS